MTKKQEKRIVIGFCILGVVAILGVIALVTMGIYISFFDKFNPKTDVCLEWYCDFWCNYRGSTLNVTIKNAPIICIDWRDKNECELDPEAEGLPIARTRTDNAGLQRVMSNSFGFGGTNASLVFQRFS